MTDDIETTAAPRSDAAGLSTAMQNVDRQEQIEAGVGQALADPVPAKPAFAAHSTSLSAILAAQEMGLKEHVAEIDAKIAELNAERDDAMLAFSMVQAARTAKARAAT